MASTAKTPRVLACVRCSRRKLKCERRFPCSNCVSSGCDCVPTPTTPRQRRRRFTERHLLDHIRRQEELLRANGIAFQPLHESDDGVTQTKQGRPSPAETLASETTSSGVSPAVHGDAVATETLNLWRSIDQEDKHAPSMGDAHMVDDTAQARPAPVLTQEEVVHEAMDQLAQDDNFPLFMAPSPDLDLSQLRPGPTNAFALWQVYLDNVNPLLKVTHTPTLQTSIIGAISNPSTMEGTLEALMFGVYSVAVLSLTEADCLTMFHIPRLQLLARYQIGCREALLRCRFLRTRSRDCLTALLLYLISVKPSVDRRSLLTLLGTAMRIAQHIGIDNETLNSRQSPFEGEMRRRLWWALVLFDARVCESSGDFASSNLIPTWSCRMPNNLNDSDVRLDMTSLPEPHERPTEVLYVMVRCALAQHARHSKYNLDFINSAHRNVRRNNTSAMAIQGEDELFALENMLQRKYASALHLENPLHLLAQLTLRIGLAKLHLTRYYWRCSMREQTEAHSDEAMSAALESIECEAELSNAPQIKGFFWHATHFPFLAYVHVVTDLKKRPSQQFIGKAWSLLSDDFRTRFAAQSIEGNPIFLLLAKDVNRAWAARQLVSNPPGEEVPWIVREMRRISELSCAVSSEPSGLGRDGEIMNGGLDDFLPQLTGDDWDHDIFDIF